MARSKEDRKRALDAYLLTRSVESVSRLTGISPNTLYKWQISDRWKIKLEEHLAKQALTPLDTKKTDELIAQFDIPQEDGKLLAMICTVEGICIKCITDDEKSVNETIKGLKPRSFVEATNALQKCWTMRMQIFHKDGSNDTNAPGTTKIAYVENMNAIFQNKEKEKLEQ